MWLSRNMSLASIGVLVSCLVMIGASILLILNLNAAFGWLESQNVVLAFAKTGTVQEDLATLETDLRNLDNISNCEFVPKEEALETLKQSMGKNSNLLSYFDNDNPLPDTFRLTVSDLSKYDETVSQIKAVPNINGIGDRREDAQTLLNLRKIIANVSIWIIALLIIISLFIISNTIKITMFVRRLEISIMKSVGATNRFITFPFMIEGIILGIISAVVSLGILYGVYTLAIEALSVWNTDTIPFGSLMWPVLGIFVAIGALTGMIGSTISIRRFLKGGGGGVYDIE